ncbi:MAG: hypothetical protein Aurels2KO_31810 [Aureliella sp.]
MPGFKELNEVTSLAEQMQAEDDGPVVLINVFTVNAGDEDALVDAWKHDADFMREQPGYISTQMHKGIGGSPTFVNYAVWENVESFRRTFQQPEFQKRISQYPPSAVASPHQFTKMAVPGHCVE